MNLRQAKKICDNCKLFRDLVCVPHPETGVPVVIGMRTKKYTFGQFKTAYRRINNYYKKYYEKH